MFGKSLYDNSRHTLDKINFNKRNDDMIFDNDNHKSKIVSRNPSIQFCNQVKIKKEKRNFCPSYFVNAEEGI